MRPRGLAEPMPGHEHDDDEEIDLHEGMPVSNEDGQKLGTLGALLIPEDEEEAEFLILKASEQDRLVPFEAVLGVGDGSLILDAPGDAIEQYPVIAPGQDPTDDDVERAYEVYDDTAEYVADE